jgi:hypothetical protein
MFLFYYSRQNLMTIVASLFKKKAAAYYPHFADAV